jgi:amino acid permease
MNGTDQYVDVWPAVGGSILLAIFNGGPPGVIYEFIAVSVFYWIIAASLAELASAIPSSAGVVSVVLESEAI